MLLNHIFNERHYWRGLRRAQLFRILHHEFLLRPTNQLDKFKVVVYEVELIFVPSSVLHFLYFLIEVKSDYSAILRLEDAFLL